MIASEVYAPKENNKLNQKQKRQGHQSVKHPTSAQVMISWFMSSSPVLGSVRTVQSLEPAWNSVSPSLFALKHLRALSLSKTNKH